MCCTRSHASHFYNYDMDKSRDVMILYKGERRGVPEGGINEGCGAGAT